MPSTSFEQNFIGGMQPAMSSKGYTMSLPMYICVSLVIALAFWLVYKSTQDFINSTVTSTIDSIDVPLSEVYFPSVTICNINQVGYIILIYLIVILRRKVD